MNRSGSHTAHSTPHSPSCPRHVQIRHDDVVHYQKIKYDECQAAVGTPSAWTGPCKRNSNPCELVLYQSLNRATTSGGAGLTNMRPDGQKLTDGWDADGVANDKFEYPNQNQLYNGTIIPDPPSFAQYDYGERLKWGTSKKLTCCEDDSTTYNLNADGTTANATAVAYQRQCPPPDGDDDLYTDDYAAGQSLTFLRYGDNTQYIENIDHEPYQVSMGQSHFDGTRTYTRHCFHNRSLQSPVHFASITDFYPRNEHVHNYNKSDVNTPYDNTLGMEWSQEKHNESFYQLCVAERSKKTLCCQGTSRAPCQADSQRDCKYPGYNEDAPNGAGFCESASDITNGCDCDMCFGDNHNPDTWVPQIDTAKHYSEYFFFHEVILNVRTSSDSNPKPQTLTLTLTPTMCLNRSYTDRPVHRQV